MLRYMVLVALVLVGCTESKDSKEWKEWAGKKEASYQEKFSSPSIVHHIYLEKEGDQFYAQKLYL